MHLRLLMGPPCHLDTPTTLAQRGITLKLTDAAKDKLAKDGNDPVYGARPLKRLIQQEIENPLARKILAGELADGETITLDAKGEGFVCIHGESNAAR